ncbi:CpaF family protein [Lutispora sp.]|uniref:CpaF family protein n=1 Tax=Lutispora sp. TaxID=2828727 RepID=UPI002B21599F|nr:CpaF family protein [Lutispora sp.]MEA4963547.1 CpaF family protein [Lutispora sp.]
MSVEEYIKERQLAFRDNEGTDKMTSFDRGEVKRQITKAVKEKISESRSINIADLNETKKDIRDLALKLIEEEVDVNYGHLLLKASDKYEILDILMQNMFGYGVIEPYIKDESVTEIMINGSRNIFIEARGIITRALDRRGNPLEFSGQEELKNIIDKIVAPINRKVDESDPIVDARLPDGSRVNVVLNPVSLDGAAVTIRKFPQNPYTMEQLVEFGAISLEAAELLKIMVRAKYNIIVSGSTGSGKTTFLNALSMFIPENSRVVTIEDSAELKFSQVENKVRLEARPPNLEGKGEITIRSLVKTALRMRPDRIVVGEVRGGEALDMLQAMNTGHDGSLSTGHANSAVDMLMRLETMVLMSGVQLPLLSVRQQIASAVDIIVHLSKLRDGTRRVMSITEILGIEDGEIIATDIFSFRESDIGGGHENEHIKGVLEWTGERIARVQKFSMAGIQDYCKYLKGV